jgi:O-antigen ligase
MAVAFLIPTFKKFVPGFIGLLALYCIVFAVRRHRTYFRQTHPSMIIMALYFLILITGAFFTDHPDVARMEIEIKFSLIAFPVISWMLPVLSRKNFDKIATAFVNGCLLFIPAALAYGIYRSVKLEDASYLSYEQLSINYHPTYAATYQCLSLFVLLSRAASRRWLLDSRLLHYTGIILTAIFISLLASKAGIITALCAIVLALIYYGAKPGERLRVWMMSAISAVVLIACAMIFPASSARIGAMVENLESEASLPAETGEARSSTELRKVTWSAAMEVLSNHPFGAGTGNTQFLLNAIYERDGQNYAAQKNLNTHNQFLQTGAEHGWPGILTLCALMILQIAGMFRLRNNVMLCIIGICALNFLFESYLEVQAGIVFYCFWSMIYARSQRPEI